MYVFREYSLRGSNSNHTIPTMTQRAEMYGGSFKSRGSLLNASIVGTTQIVSGLLRSIEFTSINSHIAMPLVPTELDVTVNAKLTETWQHHFDAVNGGRMSNGTYLGPD